MLKIGNEFKELIERIIIETGSNPNGKWIKYSDGTMICRKRVSGTYSFNSSWGSLYVTGTHNLGKFAEDFIDIPDISINILYADVQSYGAFVPYIRYRNNELEVEFARADNIISPLTASIIAIGKWK